MCVCLFGVCVLHIVVRKTLVFVFSNYGNNFFTLLSDAIV